jgi:hypothetical protein
MIDENNPIDEPILKEVIIRPDSMLIESTTSEIENNEGGKGRVEKASKLPKFVRRKEKSRKENESNENINKEPKSPLLSVAHSVKVLRIGRNKPNLFNSESFQSFNTWKVDKN